jgi:hypothetical protein
MDACSAGAAASRAVQVARQAGHEAVLSLLESAIDRQKMLGRDLVRLKRAGMGDVLPGLLLVRNAGRAGKRQARLGERQRLKVIAVVKSTRLVHWLASTATKVIV